MHSKLQGIVQMVLFGKPNQTCLPVTSIKPKMQVNYAAIHGDMTLHEVTHMDTNIRIFLLMHEERFDPCTLSYPFSKPSIAILKP
jgi:hypothetical protein